MKTYEIHALRDFYYRELTENILPFWMNHARDAEAGGYHTCLNRDGSVYDYDKVCMWHAGRIIWTYAHMYNELEDRPEYLDMASWGIDFLDSHGFAPDGTMYYALTREGAPLEPKQGSAAEMSSVLGVTEYARASGDEQWYLRAKKLFEEVWETYQHPGKAQQCFIAQTRPVRQHGHAMITLNVLQELRRFREEPQWEEKIDQCISLMLEMHMKEDKKAVFELVAWDGSEIPGHMGRWINPGHIIEGGIFLIHEGLRRNDQKLRSRGADWIEWGFQWGWDKDYGGIYNDIDSQGLPMPTSMAFVGESKLWWQHAEALYALLLAYAETGRDSFLRSYRAVHEYSFTRFADPVYGEWFANLDRRGNRVGDAKGTARKNSFHIGRNFLNCFRLLERMGS